MERIVTCLSARPRFSTIASPSKRKGRTTTGSLDGAFTVWAFQVGYLKTWNTLEDVDDKVIVTVCAEATELI
jgi:hypothetical protein